ncbi:hypothetical protein PF003_g14566 [Phytophthora fragariae]|nr:hypothetical protein PF003_g14566 [Phytophthora fragariae]
MRAFPKTSQRAAGGSLRDLHHAGCMRVHAVASSTLRVQLSTWTS